MYWFLLHNNVNQLEVYIDPFSLEPLFHLPSPWTPSLPVITEKQAEFLVLCSNFPLSISHLASIYMSMLLSCFVPWPSPVVSTSPFSMSASPFLSCKQVHQYCFPRFRIYAFIYDIWASQVALVVKNLSASAGDVRDVGLTPELGRSPGGGHGRPLQYSCLENPMDREAWWAPVNRVAKSQT